MKTWKFSLLLAIIVFLAGTAAWADQVKAVDQPHNLTLASSVKVGDTTLPAGDYKVQHVMQGDTHVMVFTSSNKKTTARVNCKMVELPKKAEDTSKTYAEENGQRVLKSVTFKGESYRHEF
jgi:hypothetical protein